MALDKDDIKQLIAILQKGLVDDQDDKQETIEEEPKPKKNKIKTKQRKVQTNSKKEFLNMGIAHLHKEDRAIDKALSKFPPTPRRRAFRTIDVTCRSCGKKETINPSLLYDSADRYKCNTCCSSPG